MTPPPTGTAPDDDVVLVISDLHVDYGAGQNALHAVDGVSFSLRRGEVFGIAGESGSGKSTLAYGMTRLLRPPGLITDGVVSYHPRHATPVDILAMSDEELRQFRWSEVAIVFQNAMSALNPVLTLQTQVCDVLKAHRPQMSRAERLARMGELLSIVGISADRSRSFPHELSGGMRQRAVIAIALALEPEIVVMDEPTTALDVVLQQQILAEMMKLRDRLGFSIIFITHDLSLLLEIADTIAVMYAGRVVEIAPAARLGDEPRHPYSQGLLQSFPLLSGPRQVLTGIPGSPPNLRAVPSGCPFNPRCSHAFGDCRVIRPVLGTIDSAGERPGHKVACHLYGGSRAASADATSAAEVSRPG
ncbi:MAG TPA: ABC transporter ATP-binding protein [Acidimicrobiales bacterium]|nr:ABC transporter ATP-binding protein [Acidimicrobiales bacterium]